ncbi:MAG: GTPase Era [Verrucomicrobia bacterium]|nr:GTPase Era [Verrucomicrobiota bacterium]
MGNPNFKSGFAVLVGRTNVGKSTLLNALVGTKIAIVTPKPQTTRDTYHGIVTRPEGQIVFVDTPGIFQTQPSRLVSNLHHKVRDALEGIDVVVHVADPSRPIGAEDHRVLELVAHAPRPKILVLNKLDLPSLPFRATWLRLAQGGVAAAVPAAPAPAQATGTGATTPAPGYASVIEVSAIKSKNIDLVIQAIFRHLPVGPAHYPEGQVTNVTNEFWISELIREKLYLKTSQEVPYTATVQLEKIEDRKTKAGEPMLYIKAVILTTDDRHQRMLIGQGARKIKDIGSFARKELEVAMNRKIFLDLDVLVDDRWMDKLT